jgi:hypothetical protein
MKDELTLMTVKTKERLGRLLSSCIGQQERQSAERKPRSENTKKLALLTDLLVEQDRLSSRVKVRELGHVVNLTVYDDVLHGRASPGRGETSMRQEERDDQHPHLGDRPTTISRTSMDLRDLHPCCAT